MSNRKTANRKQHRKQGLIFVVSGPSGSGKTTLLKGLLKDRSLNSALVKSISLTTRSRRSGERNKRDYFFVSPEEFRQKLKAKKILEWTKYLGYYYATPKDFVERQLKKKKNLLLCLDLKGASKIKQHYPGNAVTIFINPPSLGALRLRIESRCHKTRKEEVSRRLALATEELRASCQYDYCIMNKNLYQAMKSLKNIILKETGIN